MHMPSVSHVPQASSWSEGLKEQGYTLTGSKAARLAATSALSTSIHDCAGAF